MASETRKNAQRQVSLSHRSSVTWGPRRDRQASHFLGELVVLGLVTHNERRLRQCKGERDREDGEGLEGDPLVPAQRVAQNFVESREREEKQSPAHRQRPPAGSVEMERRVQDNRQQQLAERHRPRSAAPNMQ